MKFFSSTSCAALSLLALHLPLAAASPSPDFFDDIKTAWDDTQADATSLSSGTNSATSSGSTATATATAIALTYPACPDDASQPWCGIVIAGPANDSTFSVSITDSRCRTVATQTGVRSNSTRSFDTSVGKWTFGWWSAAAAGQTGVLNMSYNGRDISDPSKWDTYGYEVVGAASDAARLFGGITNCTAAKDESSAAALSVVRAGWGLAALAVGMLAIF